MIRGFSAAGLRPSSFMARQPTGTTGKTTTTTVNPANSAGVAKALGIPLAEVPQ